MNNKGDTTLRFKIGVLLLILHVIIGDGLTPIAAAIATKTGKPLLIMLSGVGCYGFSLILAGIGIVLAGPEGVQAVKELWHKMWKFRKDNAGKASSSEAD